MRGELRTPLRSEPGRACILGIDRREAQAEAIQWRPYLNALTPQERKRLREGDYRSFRRPLKHRPQFGPGDWLNVTRNLDVRISVVEPHKGRWRIRIDRVQDFRGSGTPIRTYGEDRDSMGNTMQVAHANPPEQAGPGEEWLRRFAEEAEVKRGRRIRDAIEG